MKNLFLLAMLLADLFVTFAEFSTSTLSGYDHFSKPLSETIRTGGRLSERQIAYVASAGYASIISVFNFTTDDSIYNGVIDTFPSSDNEIKIGKSLGLNVFVFDSQLSETSATSISDLIINAPKPVYICCHVGWTASLFSLLHLFRVGAISSSHIYSNGLSLGWDYQSNADAIALIQQVSGVEATLTAPTIELTLTNNEASYKSYYWTHRVGNDNWYNLGQPLSNHVDAIQGAGYKTVISFRTDGEATTHISTDPIVGFVDNNEFSDSNGYYSVSMEQKAWTDAGLVFMNLPIVSGSAASWTKAAFDKVYPSLVEAEARGAVFTHCASGYRSAAYVVAFLGIQQKQCTPWALQQASYIGFDYLNSPNAASKDVVSFLQQVLGC